METPRVLLVDDSRVVRKIVELTLWRERIEVVTASDGLGALASVADTQPDLMLLDILLPRMDGYQVCQVVRHHPDYRRADRLDHHRCIPCAHPCAHQQAEELGIRQIYLKWAR
jgi:CheY-like chemotaxis protein